MVTVSPTSADWAIGNVKGLGTGTSGVMGFSRSLMEKVPRTFPSCPSLIVKLSPNASGVLSNDPIGGA